MANDNDEILIIGNGKKEEFIDCNGKITILTSNYIERKSKSGKTYKRHEFICAYCADPFIANKSYVKDKANNGGIISCQNCSLDFKSEQRSEYYQNKKRQKEEKTKTKSMVAQWSAMRW